MTKAFAVGGEKKTVIIYIRAIHHLSVRTTQDPKTNCNRPMPSLIIDRVWYLDKVGIYPNRNWNWGGI